MKATNTSASKPEAAPTPKKDRSPNYPMLTFMDSLGRAKQIFEKDGTHPMTVEVAVKHMGLALNGRTRMIVAALKHYGLLTAVGAQVRVTDEAKAALVYAETEPKRMEIVRRLAMLPKVFQQLRAKFPDSLPSDENLAATLQLEMQFTKDATPTLIKVYRHALEVAGPLPAAEQAGEDVEVEGVAPPFAPPSAPGRERHSWKLGGSVWAELTITGTLDAKRLEKLKGFVALLDAEE